MRRTKPVLVLGVLAALVFTPACESFLDPSPSDVITSENFYKTASDAVAAVNAVYEAAKWAYWPGFWYVSDIATDDSIAAPRLRSGGYWARRTSCARLPTSTWSAHSVTCRCSSTK